jgi:hypothetical protein
MYFSGHENILIIVPDGGMLFEAAGIADILMQANRLHPEGPQPRYRLARHHPTSSGDPWSVRVKPAGR